MKRRFDTMNENPVRIRMEGRENLHESLESRTLGWRPRKTHRKEREKRQRQKEHGQTRGGDGNGIEKGKRSKSESGRKGSWEKKEDRQEKGVSGEPGKDRRISRRINPEGRGKRIEGRFE
jgi:hypothetical protein